MIMESKNVFGTTLVRKMDPGCRGAHMVEAALILPILLVLFAGVVDFSRAFIAITSFKQKVAEQSRNAGLSVFSGTDTSALKAANEASLLEALNTIRGISSPTPTVNFDALNTQQADKMVTVQATAQFNFLALRMIGLRSITISDTVKSRLEWQRTQPAGG